MSDYKSAVDLITQSKKISVIQADNPDGDSLASSLALEAILSDLGKQVSLVCGIDMPAHLRYMPGWDRVSKQAPTDCDLVIIVDTNTESLFESLSQSGQLSWLKTKSTLIIDHHTESSGISWATETLQEICVATGEVIFRLTKAAGWPIPQDGAEALVISILSDSLGFASEATTAESLRIVAELVEGGVSIAMLENARRELTRREPELLSYKGKLLQRIEISADGQIASVTVPWEEIQKYSHLYNPTMLVMDDMRMTVGVKVAIGFKLYNDGRVTAKIRCNQGVEIAATLAAHFGGGGHPYAAGFKVTDGRSFEDVKNETLLKAEQLLSREQS